MGFIPPVIRYVIVHLGRIPHRVCQEGYRIFVKRRRVLQHYAHGGGNSFCFFGFCGIPGVCSVPGPFKHTLKLTAIAKTFRHGRPCQLPPGGGDCLACGAVHDLPPFLRVMVTVRYHLLVKISFHKVHLQMVSHCCKTPGHKVELLAFLHMLNCKFIVTSCHKIGGINFRIQRLDILIQLCPVTVADGISAPALHQLPCLLQKPGFTGKCNPSSCLGHVCILPLIFILTLFHEPITFDFV